MRNPGALVASKWVNRRESGLGQFDRFAIDRRTGSRVGASCRAQVALLATWDPTPPLALICHAGCRALRSNPPSLKLRRAGLGSRRPDSSTPSRTTPQYPCDRLRRDCVVLGAAVGHDQNFTPNFTPMQVIFGVKFPFNGGNFGAFSRIFDFSSQMLTPTRSRATIFAC